MGKKIPKRREWRKADVSDVEDALEDDRLVNKLKSQAIKGQGADANDADGLFTVDTAGSCQGLSASSRREIARAKIFPTKRANIGMTASELAKVDRAGDRAERQQLEASKQPKRLRGEPELFDLWSAPTAAQQARKDAEDPEVFQGILKKTKSTPTFTPKTMHQKVGTAPAVIPAHEGQSVNPDSEAFEDLACMAAARQIEAEREGETIGRKMRPMTAELIAHLGAEAVEQMDDEAKVQMYRLLKCTSSSSSQLDGEPQVLSNRALKKQKSQSQRNKEKTRKLHNSKEEQSKAQKKLERSVGEVGAMLKDMKEEEMTRTERKKYKEEIRAQRAEMDVKQGVVPSTRRLGRTKFEEQELVLPKIATGLRSMPLQGSGLKDRMTSIIRRGLLPAPPESTKTEADRRRRSGAKFRKKLKFMSPLLRDNILLR
mmetsp:Transcript_37432/g.60319  ORF Transcript_37432/g.60319 Transcript_37432/m.60319 type:complete len:429 (+) Transcript_37432:98-1384(+)